MIDETKYFARISIAGTVHCITRYDLDGAENVYIYVKVPHTESCFGDILEGIFKIYLADEALVKWRGKIFAGDYICLNAAIESYFGYGFSEYDYRFPNWYKTPKITVYKASDIILVEPQKIKTADINKDDENER